MKGLKAAGGYTITETMFFLVITTTLLASGLLVFSGRNTRTQYSQAIRETDQNIRTIINEVGSGFFPSPDFDCSNPGPGPLSIPENSGNPAGSSEQGTRSDCIFLGKAIHFAGNEINVYTLAGARKNDAGVNVTTIEEAKPQVVESLTQTYNISSSYDVYRVIEPTGTNCPSDNPQGSAVVAYFQTLGSIDSAGDPISGAQTTDAYVVCTTGINQAEGDLIATLNDSRFYMLPKDGGVKICIGEEGRHGSITMSPQGQKFGTVTEIDDDSGDCE